jgi:iron(III) transport system ATP-binding protein
MVTHDQEEALTMADKIVVMNQAVIEQIGTPEEIYKDPATPFVADFVGTINLIENASDLYGIRPENIVLSLEKCKVRLDGPHIDAVVQSVEYKGSMTRIYAASLRDDRVLCAISVRSSALPGSSAAA